MARTRDRDPGVADEEGIDFSAEPLATSPGQVRFDGSRFSFFDSLGEYDPRSGGGISEVQHEGLDTLTHCIAEAGHGVITNNAQGMLESVVLYTDATLTTKIREYQVTYSGGLVASQSMTQYDAAGVALKTVTVTHTGTTFTVAVS